MKIEFSGLKVIFELLAIALTFPLSYLAKDTFLNYFQIQDNFFVSIILYCLLWWFFKSWARFYVWVQDTEWSS